MAKTPKIYSNLLLIQMIGQKICIWSICIKIQKFNSTNGLYIKELFTNLAPKEEIWTYDIDKGEI